MLHPQIKQGSLYHISQQIMNRKMKKIFFQYYILSLMFLISCSHVKQQELSIYSEYDGDIKNPYNIDSSYYSDMNIVELNKEDSALLHAMNKMEKNEILNDNDYKIICTSIFREFDFSEGFGYIIFSYLQNNHSNNEAFAKYLFKQTSSFKDSVLSNLVLYLCIDLEINDYSYDSFIQDFPLFKDNVLSKQKFENCMNNRVD